MKSGLLIAAILASFVSANAGWALDGKVFPGKGSKETWLSASRFGNDGIALTKAKKYDAAVAKFQHSIAMYPHADAFYRGLGVIYEQRAAAGDLKKAEKAYQKACELDSKDWKNWNALGNVLYDLGHKADSKQAFIRALACSIPAANASGLKTNIAQIDRELAAR